MKTENLRKRISKKETQTFESQYEEVQNWLGNIESPKARSEYIKHLMRYCESTELNPTQLIELKQNGDKTHKAEKLLNKFVRESQESAYPNSMLCSTVIAVKSFYKWNLESLESACGKVSRIKQKPYRTPDKQSAKDFLEGANIRDKALITVIACSGISEGSLPDLKWAHIWEDLIKNPKQTPHIGLSSTEIKGKGKGVYADVEQHTFLTPFASKALLKYKAWRERREKRKMTPEDYMFVTLDKPYKKLELITIRAIFLRRSEESGISFSCHDFRRFVQTELEHARLQPNWIKKILRHKVKGEEAPYSRPKIEQLRNAYKEAIPYLDLSEKPMISEEAIIQKLKDKLDRDRVMKEFAKKMGVSFEKVQELAKAHDLMKLKEKPFQAKLRELSNKHKQADDCQKIVNENELEEWLTKGFKVVAVLPSGKVVVSNE